MVLLSNNEYQCTACDHRSKFKNNMQKHIEAKHINHGPESCHYCEKQCASKQALQKHVSRYHREILFQIYILLPVYFWEIYFIQTKVVYLLGISNSNSGSPQERPVITKVQVKKSLLKTIGNAKQCLLCNISNNVLNEVIIRLSLKSDDISKTEIYCV